MLFANSAEEWLTQFICVALVIKRVTFFFLHPIAMAKAAFSKKKTLFYQQIGLKFEKETNKMLHLEHGFLWC